MEKMKRFLIGFNFPNCKKMVDYVIGFGEDIQKAKENFFQNTNSLPFAVNLYSCYEIPDFIEGCILDNRKIAQILKYYELAKHEYFAFINR